MSAKTFTYSSFYQRPLPMVGLILVAIGIIWFGQDVGWIPQNINVWPVVLIIIGLIMIINRFNWRPMRQ